MDQPQQPKKPLLRQKQGIRDTELAPLDIIRTETVFSRLPIHQLSKKGTIDIRIIRRERDGGQISLYWKVSPNRDFGEPRQLAYKLDKLIVDRRIDEIGRPIPRIIRLGSLHSIAQKLGLQRHTNELKKIFRQNALLGITARVKYRNAQGREESIDSTFTRYTVYFRGQELPDGKKAETVFLGFNDPYLQVVNNSVTRPQDYQYLAQLPPTAQRFYELASFKIFAALSNNYPAARLSYAEFCMTAPQTRYQDYEHFKKQMYKIHRPHLQSGYLKDVRYVATRDAEGKVDWDMVYTPGPRAHREYRAFSRRQIPARSGGTTSVPLLPERQLDLALSVSPLETVQRFHERARGVFGYTPGPGSKEVAQAEKLLKAHGLDRVNFIIDFAIRRAEQTNFRMQTFGAIGQYVPEALKAYDRIKRDEEEAKHTQAEREAVTREETEAERNIEQALQALTADEHQALYDQVKNDLIVKYPEVRRWKPEVLESTIKAKMAARLASDGRHA